MAVCGLLRRRARVCALVAALCMGIFAGSAAADPPTSQITSGWVPNSNIFTIAVSGNTAYVGGLFTWIGPITGYGAAVDGTTALPLAAAPYFDDAVLAVVPDGATGWYVGGSFTQIGGVAHAGLAHILSDGSLDPSFTTTTSGGIVRALALVGTRLYVGGSFTTIGGVASPRLAAVDTSTSVVDAAWAPAPGSDVWSLAATTGAVYAGGDFTSIGGASRNRLARLSPSTGLADAWDPSADNSVRAIALATSGATVTTVYAAGTFANVGGAARSRIAALDPAVNTANATAWNPNSQNSVFALALSGTTLYAGGSFDTIGGAARPALAALDTTVDTSMATAWDTGLTTSNSVLSLSLSGTTLHVGGDFQQIGGQTRNNLAAVSTATGSATSFAGMSYGSVNAVAMSGGKVFVGADGEQIGGVPRNRIAAIDLTTGTATSWNPDASGEVDTLHVDGSSIYVGGNFTTIGGASRNRLAKLSLSTGLADAGWNPGASDQVTAFAAQGSWLYVIGRFTTVGGLTRNLAARVDLSTGAVDPTWNPNGAGSFAYRVQVAADGSAVYIGGRLTGMGGGPAGNIAKVSGTGTGAVDSTWTANALANNWIETMVLDGSKLYVGGRFTGPNSIGGAARNRLAALDTTTGLADPAWDPNANSNVYGMIKSGSVFYVGGDFTTVGGQARGRLTSVDAATGAVGTWNPALSAYALAFAETGSLLVVAGNWRTANGVLHPKLGLYGTLLGGSGSGGGGSGGSGGGSGSGSSSGGSSCTTASGTVTVDAQPGCDARVVGATGPTAVGVTVPAGASSSGIRVRVQDVPSSDDSRVKVTNGSRVIDLTAISLADGSSVTSFSSPLLIHFPAPVTGVPAWSRDGDAWTGVPRLSRPSLPDEQRDGWYGNTDGSIDLYTRHATYFALLAPGAPTGIKARLRRATITLSWKAGTGGSAVDHYDVRIGERKVAATRGRAAAVWIGHVAKGKATLVDVVAVDAGGFATGTPKTLKVTRVARPKGVPKHVPAWAWVRITTGAKAATAAGAPKRIPAWYGSWSRWRHGLYRLSG